MTYPQMTANTGIYVLTHGQGCRILLPQITTKGAVALQPGGGFMPGGVTRVTRAPHGLTPRQVQVLQLLVRDSPIQEIARHLHISARTVEGHLAIMRRQVGCATLAGLAAWAVATGAVAPPVAAARAGGPGGATGRHG